MASINSVTILDVTRVLPSSSSPLSRSEFTLPFTFFDLFWLKFEPVERIFFFHLPESTHKFFHSVILPRLKNSLSLTLLQYLPLAGQLKWTPDDPKPIILYTPNDGVSLTVAESTADLTRLSTDQPQEATNLHPLLSELSVSDHAASPISLQVTLFPGQGFSIGITVHHAVLDGKSSTMFIKSWAYICKQDQDDPSLPQELTPWLDRSVIKDSTGRETVLLNRWNTNPSKRNLKLLKSDDGDDLNLLVRATFELTREDIKILKVKVQNESKQPVHLSSFVLTCAYVLVCMVKARCGESDKDICFGFPADYRIRLNPPVPLNYFGNCVGLHLFVGKAVDFLDDEGIAIAAEKVSNVVRELENGELFEKEKERISMFKGLRSGALVVKVAGSSRFGVYGADFGWGKPRKVEMVSIEKSGAISMAESRDEEGGVEVGVVLRRDEMESFGNFFVNGIKNI